MTTTFGNELKQFMKEYGNWELVNIIPSSEEGWFDMTFHSVPTLHKPDGSKERRTDVTLEITYEKVPVNLELKEGVDHSRLLMTRKHWFGAMEGRIPDFYTEVSIKNGVWTNRNK